MQNWTFRFSSFMREQRHISGLAYEFGSDRDDKKSMQLLAVQEWSVWTTLI